MKTSQEEVVESDDPESVESAWEEKKSVCEIAVEDYVNYVMENKKKLTMHT